MIYYQVLILDLIELLSLMHFLMPEKCKWLFVPGHQTVDDGPKSRSPTSST